MQVFKGVLLLAFLATIISVDCKAQDKADDEVDEFISEETGSPEVMAPPAPTLPSYLRPKPNKVRPNWINSVNRRKDRTGIDYLLSPVDSDPVPVQPYL